LAAARAALLAMHHLGRGLEIQRHRAPIALGPHHAIHPIALPAAQGLQQLAIQHRQPLLNASNRPQEYEIYSDRSTLFCDEPKKKGVPLNRDSLFFFAHGVEPHGTRTWSGKRVSNSRPQPWQGCALPT